MDIDPRLVLEISQAHRIALVVLFGSRARGSAHPTSDVDLGVLHEEERPLSFRELADLAHDLSRAAGGELDVVDLAATDALFRFEVVRDGKLVYSDQTGRWTSFVARTLIAHDDIAPFIDRLVAGVGRAALEKRT